MSSSYSSEAALRHFLRRRRLNTPTTSIRCLALAILLNLTCHPVVAQESKEIELGGSIAAGGLGVFVEGHWALVRASIVNPTDADQEVRLVYYFDAESTRQFVRRTWVPAGSRRFVEWPARLATIPPDAKAAEGRAMVMAADEETSFDDVPGSAIVLREKQLTAVISPGDLEADQTIQGVLAAREWLGLGQRAMYSAPLERSGPRYTLGWEPAEVAVLIVKELDIDAAKRRALRRWVRAGGTLWIVADRATPEDLAQTLGGDWGITFVDRVSFNQVLPEPTPQADLGGGMENLSADPIVSEEPMTMARVIAPQYKTLMTVRGWPMLLERSVGAGRIVVTTLEARGWNDPRNQQAIQVIARTIYGDQLGLKAKAVDSAASFIDSQIGYEVAGRPTIAAVLSGYVALVLVVGLVLLARGRGEWLGPLGLAAAGAATLLLGGIGLASRGKVDPTMATLQTVRVDPGSSVATVQGSIGLFAPFEREASLASKRGGWAWPVSRAASGATRRLMWTDIDYWTWEQLPLSGGKAERLDFSTTAEFPEQVVIDLSFDETGLVGNIDCGVDLPLADMVLMTSDAIMAAQTTADPNGTTAIAVRPDAVLPTGTFLASDLLTQTQQRRSNVVASIAQSRPFDAPPMLIAWSDLIDDGLDGDADMPPRGAAVWQLPVVIKPAEPGTRVAVPWPLMTMKPVRRVGGQPAGGSVYMPQTGQWIETGLPGSFTGRFTLPEAVSPLAIDAATVVLNISAVGRPVTLSLIVDDQPIPVQTLDGPDGPRRIDLPVDRLTNASDSITLRIDVGSLDDPARALDSQSAIWQIKQLGVEVRGVTAERED